MPVFVANEQSEPVDEARLRSVAERVLGSEGYPGDAELSLLLVSADEVAGYNERFMGRTGPTDVLAFPIEQLTAGVVPMSPENGPPLALGDVVIAPAVVREQAGRFGVAFEAELALMVVHGILHLLGWDHQSDDEAEAMEAHEAELLASLGLPRR
jgi:probable rRNA maturation factor